MIRRSHAVCLSIAENIDQESLIFIKSQAHGFAIVALLWECFLSRVPKLKWAAKWRPSLCTLSCGSWTSGPAISAAWRYSPQSATPLRVIVGRGSGCRAGPTNPKTKTLQENRESCQVPRGLSVCGSRWCHTQVAAKTTRCCKAQTKLRSALGSTLSLARF
jgi:hypothetical protein